MKIAIVGAGVSGLTCIRKAREFNVECVAFEITENIGGTWVYYGDVRDEFRDQVPTSMYYSLRTNLPTAIMEFRGYKFQPESGNCYPSRAEVLKYIEDFATDFNLIPYIKFSHKVMKISQKNEKWTVTVKNLKNGQFLEQEFDGVMVCSGHFSVPNYPSFPGMDTFPGNQVHSCYYRKNEFCKDKIVLMIGKGPSAFDLCREVAQVAVKVFLSHRGGHLNIPHENITQKPLITKIEENLIHFEDGTCEFVDSIVYCTGYKYEYPFLDATCEITNDNMILNPLYKYFINAMHPTMCILGLLQKTIIFQLLDLQAETFIRLFTGHAKLPSTKEMLSQVRKEYDEKIKANIIGSKFYYLGSQLMRKYFQDLYDLGHCEPFPTVLFDVYHKNGEILESDYDNLRNQVYEVIDDYTFKFRLKGEETKETD